MAVVDAETVEGCGQIGHILRYVLPKPRVRRRAVSIAELHAVSPYNDFTSEVCLGGPESKVGKWVGVPNPPVVGDRVDFRFSVLQSREVGFDERVTERASAYIMPSDSDAHTLV